jgi:hypothetical protein
LLELFIEIINLFSIYKIFGGFLLSLFIVYLLTIRTNSIHLSSYSSYELICMDTKLALKHYKECKTFHVVVWLFIAEKKYQFSDDEEEAILL